MSAEQRVEEIKTELEQISSVMLVMRMEREELRRRLRQLREEGGSPDEVTEIIERTRAGLEWLMRFDPSRAREIKAFLAGSALRIRKRMLEKRRC